MTILETKFIFPGPVFHFHDYGRKNKISLDLHVHTYKISRIICRCSIYSMNICLHISIYLYIPKIQCNLLVGFNGNGFMPWAFGSF